MYLLRTYLLTDLYLLIELPAYLFTDLLTTSSLPTHCSRETMHYLLTHHQPTYQLTNVVCTYQLTYQPPYQLTYLRTRLSCVSSPASSRGVWCASSATHPNPNPNPKPNPNPNPNPNPSPSPSPNPNQVRFLGENAKKDPAAYLKFFAEFGQFIKEGASIDSR